MVKVTGSVLALVLLFVLAGCATGQSPYAYRTLDGEYYGADGYASDYDDGYYDTDIVIYGGSQWYPWTSLDYFYLGNHYYRPWSSWYLSFGAFAPAPWYYPWYGPFYYSAWYSPFYPYPYWYAAPAYGWGGGYGWYRPYGHNHYPGHGRHPPGDGHHGGSADSAYTPPPNTRQNPGNNRLRESRGMEQRSIERESMARDHGPRSRSGASQAVGREVSAAPSGKQGRLTAPVASAPQGQAAAPPAPAAVAARPVGQAARPPSNPPGSQRTPQRTPNFSPRRGADPVRPDADGDGRN